MERRRGIATEISQESLTRWLATGDLRKPYHEPTSTQYGISSNPETRCQNCKFFEQGICSNPIVQLDPRVPETHDGLKMVKASGWCQEWSTSVKYETAT